MEIRKQVHAPTALLPGRIKPIGQRLFPFRFCLYYCSGGSRNSFVRAMPRLWSGQPNSRDSISGRDSVQIAFKVHPASHSVSGHFSARKAAGELSG